MQRLIAGHNKKVIARAEGKEDPPSYGCNCDDGTEKCPLGGECKTPSLVYKAEVDMGEGPRVYIGQTANTFNCGRRRTGLTSYILDQEKKGNVCQDLRWSKITNAKPQKKGELICSLCNIEKTQIAIANPSTSLNKRSEILQRCRHRDKLVLSNNLSSHHVRRPTRIERRLDDIGEETETVEETDIVEETDTMEETDTVEETREDREEQSGSGEFGEDFTVGGRERTEGDQGGCLEDIFEENIQARMGPILRSRGEQKVDYKKFF